MLKRFQRLIHPKPRITGIGMSRIAISRVGIHWVVLGLAFFIQACATSDSVSEGESKSYGLEGEDEEEGIDIPWSRLNPNHRARDLFSARSFPVNILIGKGGGFFANPPKDGQPPRPVSLLRPLKKCTVMIMSGAVEVYQYLYIDRFVKMRGPLESGAFLRVQPGQSTYLKLQVVLLPRLQTTQFRNCAEHYFGKTVLLGYFDVQKTRIKLVSTPQSTTQSLTQSRWPASNPKAIFLSWPTDEPYPLLVDEDGGQAELSTLMYGIRKAKGQGRYQLAAKIQVSARWKGPRQSPARPQPSSPPGNLPRRSKRAPVAKTL